MVTSISSNIRKLRKERKLTQEQIAEVFGVTVGAVSKWESGASMPDVSLIMEMADFFETSVDVLLGYQRADNNLRKILEDVRSLRNRKRFDEAAITAEKALVKYPNNFEVNFKSAVMYCTMGVERKDKKAYYRSLGLFQRALELIGQNTDEKINEWTIRNNIAQLYLSVEQPDKALEVLKQNNADGLNNGIIGFTLASAAKKPNEALPYLSDALIDEVTKLYRITNGYLNAYIQLKDYASALGCADWLLQLLKGLEQPGEITYINRETVQLSCACAAAAGLAGDLERAKTYLRQAKQIAAAFDAAPSYNFVHMRFYHGSAAATAFDDFGETATVGIQNFIDMDKDNKRILQPLWDELRSEEQTA